MKHITNIEGVFAGGIHSGIKANKEKKDLAFIFVPGAVASAGVFTKNKFVAPCLSYTRNILKNSIVKAAIINSGNANAATGELGYKNAEETALLAAKELGISKEEVAIASTGIIGKQLPMDAIRTGLKQLLKDKNQKNGSDAADAILTTDTFKKEYFAEKVIDGVSISVAGITKGSGMIAPNMATMLGFVVSDIDISQELFQGLISSATDKSFNMISVDNDCSTNDLVLAFASGKKKIDLNKEENFNSLAELFNEVFIELAKMIAKDGEGATKLIEAKVIGAKTEEEAKRIALSIINSPLVKTAIHGGDPNWGRVLAAAGKVENTSLDPDKAVLKFQQIIAYDSGKITDQIREKLGPRLKEKEIEIELNLNQGKKEATAWGCDLSKGYIDINVAYS